MVSYFETFSKDKISAINEAVVQTNIKKAMNFGFFMFTGRQKIIVILKLQQKRKIALDTIPEMFVNCK